MARSARILAGTAAVVVLALLAVKAVRTRACSRIAAKVQHLAEGAAGAAPVSGGPGHELRAVPKLPYPALHKPFLDPVFGTTIMRITDRSQVPGVNRIRHYYSKANPFNADETRAVFFSGDGGKWLYDTRTWNPVKSLRIVSSDPELQWHPTDPNVLYCMDFVGNSPNVRGFYRYDIRTDEKKLLRDFPEYQTARGRLEGNMDRDGRYYALFGFTGTKSNPIVDAFVYDVKNDRVSQKLRVTLAMADDWISVTQTGRYVVMMGKERSRVYDIEMNHLRDLPVGTFGHADLCLTPDGRDVMVYDGADHEIGGSNRNVNMVDLATGQAVPLVRIGWRSTPHVSCRNLDRPGWALVSTQGPDAKYPNHDFEIFWLRLDASAAVRRVAHHRSSREEGGYFAEQHAVTNRDGSKIVFASNWGDGPVADFLVDLGRGPGAHAAAPPPR